MLFAILHVNLSAESHVTRQRRSCEKQELQKNQSKGEWKIYYYISFYNHAC